MRGLLRGLTVDNEGEGPTADCAPHCSYADHVADKVREMNPTERDLFWQELQLHAERLGITGA